MSRCWLTRLAGVLMTLNLAVAEPLLHLLRTRSRKASDQILGRALGALGDFVTRVIAGSEGAASEVGRAFAQSSRARK